jgi:hypothetical protein
MCVWEKGGTGREGGRRGAEEIYAQHLDFLLVKEENPDKTQWSKNFWFLVQSCVMPQGLAV